jgi:hypothetical protein
VWMLLLVRVDEKDQDFPRSTREREEGFSRVKKQTPPTKNTVVWYINGVSEAAPYCQHLPSCRSGLTDSLEVKLSIMEDGGHRIMELFSGMGGMRY